MLNKVLRTALLMASTTLFACNGGGDGGGGGSGATDGGSGGSGGSTGNLADAKVFVGLSGGLLVGYDESGQKLGSAALDTSATILEGDASGIWFLNAGLLPDQSVYHYDLAVQTLDTVELEPGTNPMDLSLGESAVWVVTGKNQLLRVDPAGKTVTDTTELMTNDVTTIDDYMRVSAGLGSVWVTSLFGENDQNLLQVDPDTLATTLAISVGDGHTGVAVGLGGVWVTTRFDTTLTKLDPTTGAVLGSIDLLGDVGGSRNNIAVGLGAVWVLEYDSNHLKRVDPDSLTLAADIALDAYADAVQVGSSKVWVLLGDEQKLLAIDPGSNSIAQTVTLDDDGYGLGVRP